MPRVALIHIAGLNTDPLSDCWGMRPFLRGIAAANDYPEPSFFAFDQVTADQLVAAAAGADLVIISGHSFGGAALKHFGDTFASSGALKIDLGLFLDPAPNADRFGQFFSWQAADLSNDARWHVPASIEQAVCWYQRNEQIIPGIIAVVGVPFAMRDGVRNVKMGPGVYHCHICSNPAVQDSMRTAIAAAVNAWQTKGP